MALIKIYTLPENQPALRGRVAKSVKLVAAAALNVPGVPTSPGSIETVYGKGIDLIGIDYILEIIAVERPNQQKIADTIISGLNQVYPDILFSVYFNNIQEIGMANTPRKTNPSAPITITEAIERSKV